LPRLKCTYREFIAIIEQHGFVVHRKGATSHVQYRGIVAGKVKIVTVSGYGGQEICPDTLRSMIRQCDLPKKLFRK
jgi:predicted RNA binding protein YcfA (HicA-like mRNA interferase family)